MVYRIFNNFVITLHSYAPHGSVGHAIHLEKKRKRFTHKTINSDENTPCTKTNLLVVVVISTSTIALGHRGTRMRLRDIRGKDLICRLRLILMTSS